MERLRKLKGAVDVIVVVVKVVVREGASELEGGG